MEKLYSVKYAISSVAIAGVIAGAVMIIPMMGMMGMMNLPPDLFSTVVGMMMGAPQESASMAGMALHFVPSIIIGLIFGIIISSSKLTITGFKKGVFLGIGTGIVSFVILFLPLMMTVMPPVMLQLMHMMNPDAPQQMIMSQLQSMQPMLLAGSFIAHIIYGAVLGVITTSILRKRIQKVQLR